MSAFGGAKGWGKLALWFIGICAVLRLLASTNILEGM